MTVRMPALVRLADRLEPDEQPHALLQQRPRAPRRAAGRRGTPASAATVRSPYCACDSAELAGRAGEEQPVERRARGRAASAARSSSASCSSRGLIAATGQRLGAERLWPAARRVAELAGQEADDRVGDVEPGRVGRELGRVGADGDQVQGQVADDLAARGDLDDVAEDRGRPRRTCPRSARTSRPARARWPAGAGWTAGRPGSRARRPARSARAARTRTARRAAGPPPSRARGASPPPGRARSRAGCGRWRRPARTSTAGWSCRTSGRSPRRPRRPRRRSPPAAWRAGRPAVSWVCRCTGRSKRSRSAVTRVRAAGARSRPAMSLIASTCAPASTIRSASRR